MDREVGIVLINLKSYFRHWQSTLWPVALTASNDQHPPQRKKKEEKKGKDKIHVKWALTTRGNFSFCPLLLRYATRGFPRGLSHQLPNW